MTAISVLVPVYNAQDVLARCLDSVLAQTFEDFEVIAVNDGSTDHSAELLGEYAEAFAGRLLVVEQENAGVAAARNRAVKLAQGEWLAFLDNDDWLDPDYLERLYAETGAGIDIVCGGYRRPTKTGEIRSTNTLNASEQWAPWAIQTAWAKLYRRTFVIDAHLEFLDTPMGEDLCFSLPALLQARAVRVTRYCGYNWFFNEQSVSNTVQKTSQGMHFEHTLDELLARGGKRAREDGLFMHALVRMVPYFLFYTRKGDGPARADENRRALVAWLDANLDGWRDDSYARITRPAGDTLSARASTWLFVRHPRLFALALRLYPKSYEN